jgi:TPR repeat protein
LNLIKKPKMQKKDTSVKTCGFCEANEDSEHKLQTCSRCKLVVYCSKACQAAHWKNGHRQACVAVQDRKPDSLNNNQQAREGNNKTDVICVICLEPLKSSSTCTLPCAHSFHSQCVSNLRSQAASQVCPLCRTDLPPGPEQAYTECIKLFYGVINKTSKNESEDMLEAVKLGTYAAEEGNIDAQMFLGQCFSSEGLGVKQDKAKAFYWWLKAAEQGDTFAQHNIGVAYNDGIGVQQDKAKACHWRLKAAEQGNVMAQFNAGVYYHNGDGVKEDKAKAFYWFMKAAEQGNVQALFNVATYYEDGTVVKQDKAKAFYWLLKAAEQGNIQAQFSAAVYYENGMVVKQDETKAFYWYLKAAEQGHAMSQFLVGTLYGIGDCIKQDKAKGFHWCMKAAKQGIVQAQILLAGCYEDGDGVKQDKVKALHWYMKAAEQGNSEALCWLEQHKKTAT